MISNAKRVNYVLITRREQIINHINHVIDILVYDRLVFRAPLRVRNEFHPQHILLQNDLCGGVNNNGLRARTLNIYVNAYKQFNVQFCSFE